MRKLKLAWTAADNTCTFSDPVQANANVLIPKGTHVLLKESPPPLGTVVVEGVLEVDPTAAFIKMMVSASIPSPSGRLRDAHLHAPIMRHLTAATRSIDNGGDGDAAACRWDA
jgi:hypothetical protein